MQDQSIIPCGYCLCGCGQRTRLAPQSRAELGWVKGQPIRYVSGHQAKHANENRTYPRVPLAERFWQYAIPGPFCWEWHGHVDEDGYGRLWDADAGQNVAAHRVSWEIHYGPVPAGQWVLHRCDNPPCTRPTHLFLGDVQANVTDAVQKGRNTHGERHPKAKLTWDLVQAARARYAVGGVSKLRIAHDLGISYKTACAMLAGRVWTRSGR